MGTLKINKSIATALLALSMLVLMYFGFRVFVGFKHGYSWQEMDWNRDESTSIGELLNASDIGKRDVMIDGRKCIEYFAFKDGLPVKTVCVK